MHNSTGPIGTLDLTKPIIIHGAGISGLLIAYYLKQQGLEPLVYERESKPGGKIGTITGHYGIYETAANAIFTNDDVFELINELNLTFTPAGSKLKKKIFRFGKITAFPLRILEILRLLFNLFKQVPQTNIEQMSVADFFYPMAGRRVTKEVIGAGLAGIYATAPENLNFLSIFKTTPPKGIRYFEYFKLLIKLKKSQSKSKAKSISFIGGMQTFIDALHNHLKDNLRLGQTRHLSPDENHILCANCFDAAQMLLKGFPELSEELEKIEYSQLGTTTFFLKTPIGSLENSFGVVFGDGMHRCFAGVLNNTAIFPARVFSEHHYSYTVISKGENNIEVLKKEFMAFFDLESDDLLETGHTHWMRALPVYNNARALAVLKLRTLLLSQPGIVLYGNYTGGISIREMVSGAKYFAQNLAINNLTQNTESTSANSIL